MTEEHSEEDAITGVEITPLVGVALVLVMIFMVTAPLFMHPVMDIKLPKAVTGEAEEKGTEEKGTGCFSAAPPAAETGGVGVGALAPRGRTAGRKVACPLFRAQRSPLRRNQLRLDTERSGGKNR